ncbi:hypothetical protein Bb109J_c1971 [Bdellovibrio bacteriovorus]|uniref:hypothetical protein n=1 Tax=Bdellovibrio bacteriovorus TaxID=959 RepID=UPI00045C02CE|nr:hypothetical protein [Bdellovibrio bacteriovorus]AHZ84661.1 hypothetical protein EP01_06885 [Bdellovibrio bacteriovorus]BEV68551.1 hypothetical protein Bb109J_c1971 [Bdellovibrio bacteriovorus]
MSTDQNEVKFPYDQKEIYEKGIVFFAKCNVYHYQNVTEPNLYPDSYEMFVPKSDFDAVVKERDGLRAKVHELEKSRDHYVSEARRFAIKWEACQYQIAGVATGMNKDKQIENLLGLVSDGEKQIAAMMDERNRYARAMTIALSNGVFANKSSVKEQIEQVLSKGGG